MPIWAHTGSILGPDGPRRIETILPSRMIRGTGRVIHPALSNSLGVEMEKQELNAEELSNAVERYMKIYISGIREPKNIYHHRGP